MFATALCRSQTTASHGKLIASRLSRRGRDETKFIAVEEVIHAFLRGIKQTSCPPCTLVYNS